MTPYEKGKVLEKAVELFLRDMGFRVYSWEEWARKNEISAKDLGGRPCGGKGRENISGSV